MQAAFADPITAAQRDLLIGRRARELALEAYEAWEKDPRDHARFDMGKTTEEYRKQLVEGKIYYNAKLDRPKVEPAKPGEGVFVNSDVELGAAAEPNYKAMIELKDGHFRYWIEHNMVPIPRPKCPLEGTYVVDGDTIVLNTKQVNPDADPVVWRFKTVNGTVLLCGISQDSNYNEERDHLYRLHATKESPEELWTRRNEAPARARTEDQPAAPANAPEGPRAGLPEVHVISEEIVGEWRTKEEGGAWRQLFVRADGFAQMLAYPGGIKSSGIAEYSAARGSLYLSFRDSGKETGKDILLWDANTLTLTSEVFEGARKVAYGRTQSDLPDEIKSIDLKSVELPLAPGLKDFALTAHPGRDHYQPGGEIVINVSLRNNSDASKIIFQGGKDTNLTILRNNRKDVRKPRLFKIWELDSSSFLNAIGPHLAIPERISLNKDFDVGEAGHYFVRVRHYFEVEPDNRGRLDSVKEKTYIETTTEFIVGE